MALPYTPSECDAFNATLTARLFPDDPDIRAALLAYAARPRRPQPLIVSRDLFEKAKRLGLLGEDEATE
jgi:hypothetical protein